MTETETQALDARIRELIVTTRGLSLELEATRKQVAFIGEIAQETLRKITAIKAELKH